MKGKTLAVLIGMLFGTFLFFSQTVSAAANTFDTPGAGDNNFAAAANGTTRYFVNDTEDNFTRVTRTRSNTASTNFGSNTDTIGTTESTTFECGATTGTSTFTGVPFAFGGNVGSFTDGAQGFSEETRF